MKVTQSEIIPIYGNSTYGVKNQQPKVNLDTPADTLTLKKTKAKKSSKLGILAAVGGAIVGITLAAKSGKLSTVKDKISEKLPTVKNKASELATAIKNKIGNKNFVKDEIVGRARDKNAVIKRGIEIAKKKLVNAEAALKNAKTEEAKAGILREIEKLKATIG